jgi:hypothetical protein
MSSGKYLSTTYRDDDNDDEDDEDDGGRIPVVVNAKLLLSLPGPRSLLVITYSIPGRVLLVI